MTKDPKWTVLAWNTRVQGVIFGRVTDKETGQPIARAQVRIEPQEGDQIFAAWLQLKQMQYDDRWEWMRERPDRTLAYADGYYHFIGLPAGAQCSVIACLPGARQRYGESVPQLVEVTEDGVSRVDLQLPPTSIRGTVTTERDLTLVEVRIAECDAHVFSRLTEKDGEEARKGDYFLAGLEPWKEPYNVEFLVKGVRAETEPKSVEVKVLRGECTFLKEVKLVKPG